MADTLRPSIPLYRDSHAIGLILISEAECNPHLYRLRRNRRGNATSASLRHDSRETEHARASGWRSNRGHAYEQGLTTGHVWALRGIRGSTR
jgi:hypothetical protein